MNKETNRAFHGADDEASAGNNVSAGRTNTQTDGTKKKKPLQRHDCRHLLLLGRLQRVIRDDSEMRSRVRTCVVNFVAVDSCKTKSERDDQSPMHVASVRRNLLQTLAVAAAVGQQLS